jgi:hypothetical protein
MQTDADPIDPGANDTEIEIGQTMPFSGRIWPDHQR